MDTFTEIAAKWAQQAEEVSEAVDAVALLSEKQAPLLDGRSDHIGPYKTKLSGNNSREAPRILPVRTDLSHSANVMRTVTARRISDRDETSFAGRAAIRKCRLQPPRCGCAGADVEAQVACRRGKLLSGSV